MILTTTNTLVGKKTTEYFVVVTGEAIISANLFKDLFASIADSVGGRSGSYEQVLREAKDNALHELEENDRKMGANAVIGIDLDYETVGHNGSLLMVSAIGTAIRYQ
jgi:uncharacterized protein YbjQ (UPF0145 family)